MRASSGAGWHSTAIETEDPATERRYLRPGPLARAGLVVGLALAGAPTGPPRWAHAAPRSARRPASRRSHQTHRKTQAVMRRWCRKPVTYARLDKLVEWLRSRPKWKRSEGWEHSTLRPLIAAEATSAEAHSVALDTFLDQGADPLVEDPAKADSLLHAALRQGRPGLITRLLRRGADPLTQVRGQGNVLHAFFLGRHPPQKAEELWTAALDSARANQRLRFKTPVGVRGDTGLHLAIRAGDLDKVRDLLGVGVDLRAVNRAGQRPLEMGAALDPPRDDLVAVLSAAAWLAEIDGRGRAVSAGAPDADQLAAWRSGWLRKLPPRLRLAKRALWVDHFGFDVHRGRCVSVDTDPTWGRACRDILPLVAPLKLPGYEFLASLAPAAPPKTPATPLYQAALSPRKVAVQRIRDAGAEQLETRCDAGFTPLMAAAAYGRLTAAEALLAAGASPATRGYLGTTALHEAAQSGRAEIVRRLLAAGATVGAKDDLGRTPLHAAGWTRRPYGMDLGDGYPIEGPDARRDVVAALLDAGADIEARDHTGETPLLVAVRGGSPAAAAAMLAGGADADAPSPASERPRGLAADLLKVLRPLRQFLRPVAHGRFGTSNPYLRLEQVFRDHETETRSREAARRR